MNNYNKSNPYPAKIIERKLLNKKGSSKETYHLSLDLRGANFSYKVGDAIGIFPQNPKYLVDRLLKALQRSGKEEVNDPHTKTQLSLEDYLTTRVNLSRINSSLLTLLQEHETKKEKSKALADLLSEKNKTARSEWLQSHDLIDLFQMHSHLVLPLEKILPHFAPLLPRLYSISSSPSVAKEKVDLLITTFSYFHKGEKRKGISSEFLCYTAEAGKTTILVYLSPTSHFTLPTDPNCPIIMIGPGTGVAPFRGFLQERLHIKAPGKNWLIFGERNRSYDFYYGNFFQEMEKQNNLRLDLAFSRDQEQKIYVQHKLYEQGEELWQWLENKACLFICGDAKQMAKEVNIALHKIIEKHGKLSEEETKQYIKALRKEKRYLLDVY